MLTKHQFPLATSTTFTLKSPSLNSTPHPHTPASLGLLCLFPQFFSLLLPPELVIFQGSIFGICPLHSSGDIYPQYVLDNTIQLCLQLQPLYFQLSVRHFSLGVPPSPHLTCSRLEGISPLILELPSSLTSLKFCLYPFIQQESLIIC